MFHNLSIILKLPQRSTIVDQNQWKRRATFFFQTMVKVTYEQQKQHVAARRVITMANVHRFHLNIQQQTNETEANL